MGGTQIDADRSPITADTPLGPAPLAEAVPYTPKDFFFWNGFGMFQGARSLHSHGKISEDPRSICADLRSPHDTERYKARS